MIKLSGQLAVALSRLPENDDYIELDLSDCVTKENILNMQLFSDSIRNRVFSMKLPDTIDEIIYGDSSRNFAFYDFHNLQILSGDGIKKIDCKSFKYCSSLGSVDFPNATSIGTHAFDSCESLTYVNIPDVKHIDDNAFFECTSLESIHLPSVTRLGKFIFEGCRSLKSINLPKMHDVDKAIFLGCLSLNKVNLFIDFVEEFMPEVCNELFD